MPRVRKPREKGEKVFYSFQLPVELRDAISNKGQREKIDVSAFFRMCGEAFVGTSSIKEALKQVERMAASLKMTGTASRRRKHDPKKTSRIVMPDRDKLA
jgi:hypothetical protein